MLQLVRNERETVPFYDLACSLAREEEVTGRAAGSVSRRLVRAFQSFKSPGSAQTNGHRLMLKGICLKAKPHVSCRPPPGPAGSGGQDAEAGYRAASRRAAGDSCEARGRPWPSASGHPRPPVLGGAVGAGWGREGEGKPLGLL